MLQSVDLVVEALRVGILSIAPINVFFRCVHLQSAVVYHSLLVDIDINIVVLDGLVTAI